MYLITKRGLSVQGNDSRDACNRNLLAAFSAIYSSSYLALTLRYTSMTWSSTLDKDGHFEKSHAL